MVAIPLRDLRIAGGLMLVAGAAKAATGSGLGLPCPLRSATGIPCPLCGMTTSVTATMRGDIADAIAATPVGVLAVLVAVALLMIPRWTSLNLPRWAVPAALLPMWIWQLARFGFI